ncbi:MAG: FAD-dependent oxidoreductase [Deltaproteobacteria bacterium]|nr:FAD-dependent oxidoreductase [Deltaproteobacteria bacterium]
MRADWCALLYNAHKDPRLDGSQRHLPYRKAREIASGEVVGGIDFPMNPYDVTIIGAGPGGLACAIQAGQLGLRYLLLEKGSECFQGIMTLIHAAKKCIQPFRKAK